MAWVEFEGRRLPKRVGGHPAADFCNTWAGWNTRGGGVEWLPDYGALLDWTRYAGLLDAEATTRLALIARRDEPGAVRTLAEVRHLRSALHDVLLDPADSSAFGAVAKVAQRGASLLKLESGPDGIAHWALPVAGVETPLLTIGRSAADLLCGAERTAVRACPGDGCGWLFIDARSRRKWCIMAVCGNRAKARAHAQRQRQRSIKT